MMTEKLSGIRELLSRGELSLTPSEERIVQVLLTDFPTAGLGTATALARRAGVSDPTVGRLVVKLGFTGYPDFQSRLLAEVEAQLHSPLLMMEAKRTRAADGKDVANAYLASVSAATARMVDATPARIFERAARLVSEARGRVFLLGGRFSRHVAGMLADYLVQLRPGVRDIGLLSAPAFDALVDIDRRDVLIVFDFRRYQRDVNAFARQAAERGARIVLFTDVWMSPIAERADVTLVSPVEIASPYDTLAPAVAQIEAFVGQLLATIDEETRARIEALEAVRRLNAVTLDETPTPDPAGRNFPGPKAAPPRPAEPAAAKSPSKEIPLPKETS